MMKEVTLLCKVAGVAHEGRQVIIESMIGNEIVFLRHEPDNQYDKNAIAAWVTFPVEAKMDDAKIGYIPKGIAVDLLQHIRKENFSVDVHEITGGYLIDADKFATKGVTLFISYEE
jgi:hypothetical protein